MRKTPQPVAAQAPGAFLSDGSYLESGYERHRGRVDELVRRLVSDRRNSGLTPPRAALEIERASAEHAFPHREQWARSTHWPLVQCGTSAEEAIKRAGGGADDNRHWCRGAWLMGKEKDCPESCHRERPRSEDVARLVNTLGKVFED